MNGKHGAWFITETTEQRHWREVSASRQRIASLERELEAEKKRLAQLTRLEVVKS